MKSDAEHLFDASLHFVSNVEYGYSMAQVASGAAVPESGVRFDVFFEGEVRGERIKGRVSGVDYVTVGPGGVSQLHVHAQIVTEDGCHIALHADGTSRRRAGSSLADTHETVTMSTAAEPYRWVNKLKAVATGVADFAAEKIELTVTLLG